MGTQVQVLSFSNSLPLHPSYSQISPWRDLLFLSLRVFHFRCVRGLLYLSLFVCACLFVLVCLSLPAACTGNSRKIKVTD